MCHSSKHTAHICIQDNQTCHVNFILCLFAQFVLSLFLALLPLWFQFPLEIPMNDPPVAAATCSGRAGDSRLRSRFYSIW